MDLNEVESGEFWPVYKDIGYPQRLVPRAEDKDKPPNYLVEHAVISVFELRVILDRLKKMTPTERNTLRWNNKLKRLEPASGVTTNPPVTPVPCRVRDPDGQNPPEVGCHQAGT